MLADVWLTCCIGAACLLSLVVHVSDLLLRGEWGGGRNGFSLALNPIQSLCIWARAIEKYRSSHIQMNVCSN